VYNETGSNESGSAVFFLMVMAVIVLVVALIGGTCWGVPKYRVYSQEKTGEAAYKRAEQDRKIQVLEAQAALEAAQLQRQTDEERARGIAEANRIIGNSITNEYLLWRWVEGLHDGSSEVIYVPTEANLPVLEAMRKAMSAVEAADD